MLGRLLAAGVVALPLLTAGVHAHATVIAGTAIFVDTGPSGNELNFTANSTSFNFNATSGSPVVIADFLVISETDSFAANFGTQSATDSFTVTFNLTQPGLASGSLTGTGTYSETFFLGSVTASDGSIHWNGLTTIDLGGGDTLKVVLSDASFASTSVGVDATFLYTDATGGTDPGPGAAVPEPATVVLIGTGLIGMGGLMRRSRAR